MNIKDTLFFLLLSLLFVFPTYSAFKNLYIALNGKTVSVTITKINRNTKGLDTAHFVFNGEKCFSSCFSGKEVGDNLTLHYIEGLGFYPKGRLPYLNVIIWSFVELINLFFLFVCIKDSFEYIKSH